MTRPRRALLSVSDKSGIVDLSSALLRMGFELVSTGGTARTLREADLAVKDVSTVTGFPEILGGRVKTLHPFIHAAILARLDLAEQRKTLEEYAVVPFELVVVNLYPFEQIITREETDHQSALENIDIGGPTMVRAAAKNHDHVAVVVNPQRYAALVQELEEKGSLGDDTRLDLAAEAFTHIAGYDAAIAAYFNTLPEVSGGEYPKRLNLSFNKLQDLRYGENPQQSAAFYAEGMPQKGLAAARQLQGKELSFNNLNDLNAAWELALEFEQPVVVAVKHANPCGVGSAESLLESYRLAYESDPEAIFGGVIALNRPLDLPTAKEMSKIFLEVIAAPAFEEDARALLSDKKDIRLLEISPEYSEDNRYDIKKVDGGLLIQSIDSEAVEVKKGKVVTELEPTAEEWEMLTFVQRVVKHTRSNAIVIGGKGRTFGIGAGQVSRIGAARIALRQAGQKARGAVLGSDAFFPFPDTVEEAAKAGVTAIVQPGGSLKDEESITTCNKHKIAMVFSGRRYFKH